MFPHMRPIRILLLADSHLGFDLPIRPRVRRRRRGHDFQANFERALAPALEGRVDVVVHGGDVFHRSRVPASVAHAAYTPLLRVAAAGIPVLIVPGNHERSRLPHVRLAGHPGLRIFDRPRTFLLRLGGARVAFAGFPYQRYQVRSRFDEMLEQTGWRAFESDARLLVLHHCVEGATVGPSDFTFTTAPDVIRGAELPAGFAAVLSGHIHRHQVLGTDLRGRPLAAPVLYPGSVERTAIAEKDERKGFMTLDVVPGGAGGRLSGWRFHELPARPMLVREIRLPLRAPHSLEPRIRALLAEAPADAVLRLRVTGTLTDDDRRILAADRLRAMSPPTMNLELRLPDEERTFRTRRSTRPDRPVDRGVDRPRDPRSPMLELPL